MDHDLSYEENLRSTTKTATKLFGFASRFFLVVGPDQQAHLVVAMTYAHVMPGRFEPAGLSIRRCAGHRRSDVFGLLWHFPKAQDAIDSLNVAVRSPGLTGGSYE